MSPEENDKPPPRPIAGGNDRTVIGRRVTPVDAEAESSADTVHSGELGKVQAPAPTGDSLERSFVSGGSRLGSYRLLELLGRGGQGEVWMAEDLKLQRRVAIKLLAPQYLRNEVLQTRFRREAELGSKLDHPSICTVYDFGQAEGIPFIAMRYVEGESLAKKIGAARPQEGEGQSGTFIRLSSTEGDESGSGSAGSRSERKKWNDDLLLFFERCADALHYAHESGLIHRDLKPGNVMITPGGEPVILDFGLARQMVGDGADLTQSGDLLGTPAYMAPEQVAGLPLDRRTDVFSLAVVLYECLTGQRPFRGLTFEALRNEILNGSPRDPRTLNDAVPDDLATLLEVALDKDPRRRYQTARDLAQDLRRIREFKPILARPPGAVVRLQRWAQRNPWIAVSLAILFLSLSGGLLLTTHFLRASERQSQDLSRALEEVRRLSDVSLIEKLRSERLKLPPIRESSIPAFDGWLARAKELVDRLPRHRERLEVLRRQALPYDEAARQKDIATRPELRRLGSARTRLRRFERDLENAIQHDWPAPQIDALEGAVNETQREIDDHEKSLARRKLWEFESDTMKWEHDSLAQLVEKLEDFMGTPDDPGEWLKVQRWRRQAEEVAKKSLVEAADSWKKVIADIADRESCKAYDGLVIPPQLGLVPLGRDPKSGFHEFAHVLTGTIPERAPDGHLILDESSAMVLVLLPGGTFSMGAIRPDAAHLIGEPNVDPLAVVGEAPVHEVTLDPFFMGKHEVTQGQWKRFADNNPSWHNPQRRADLDINLMNPVENVTWIVVMEHLPEIGLTLPTEAQWEYAARGGTTTAFFTGDDPMTLIGYANIADRSAMEYGMVNELPSKYDSFRDGAPVHSRIDGRLPNPFGLHDVLGNVEEWTIDYPASYRSAAAPGTGAWLEPNADYRVARGGSWGDGPTRARCAARSGGTEETSGMVTGLRVARRIER